MKTAIFPSTFASFSLAFAFAFAGFPAAPSHAG